MSEVNRQQLFEPVTPLGSYCLPDGHGGCVTCGDEALPAVVLEIDEAALTATVEVSGQTSEIDISLVEEVTVGETVLVHGGVALGKLEIGD